ncbi:hypothetical protein K4A87_14740 [Xanthomonas fragariae]|nr:hypothetical protein K4A87_14740 [Xanthomonas fragariae]
MLRPTAEQKRKDATRHPEQVIAAQRSAADLCARIEVVQALGLGYLSLKRSTPTLLPSELQRLRLAMQIRSQLFGVVYVMDEPSAGLHSADAQALQGVLDPPNAAGNTIIVVVHACVWLPAAIGAGYGAERGWCWRQRYCRRYAGWCCAAVWQPCRSLLLAELIRLTMDVPFV